MGHEHRLQVDMAGARRWRQPVLAITALVVVGFALVAGTARGPASPGRCVGMFMANSPGSVGSLPRQIAADSTGLTIRGTVPCAAEVMAWAPQGPCRVFEDGTVEILVSPIPPCPGGDHYAWLAYPR